MSFITYCSLSLHGENLQCLLGFLSIQIQSTKKEIGMKKNFIMVVAIVLTLLPVSCGKKGGMNFGDNEYPVKTIGMQTAKTETSYPATIKGVQDVEIRPKISGFLTKVCVQEGQNVQAGQLLFVIDNATYQAQVRQAQAAVSTASAQVNTTKLTYDNSVQLHKNNVIGTYELQTARNSYEAAKAALAQAQAALAAARETLSFCYVKSPTNGVVGSLPFKEGALVSATSQMPLTTVSNINTVEVYFSLTEKDLLEMTKAAGSMSNAIARFPEVYLQLSDGTRFNQAGHVSKISGVIDPNTGSVSMIARFPNPQHLLKSGSSGSIVVPRNNGNAIIVAQNSTVEVQDKIFVYVLGKDNKVKYTEVKVAPENDGLNYIITEGLKPGDKIVTNGLTKLNDGMEIKPITEAQYAKKISDATKLGEKQSSAGGFVEAMKGDKK